MLYSEDIMIFMIMFDVIFVSLFLRASKSNNTIFLSFFWKLYMQLIQRYKAKYGEE